MLEGVDFFIFVDFVGIQVETLQLFQPIDAFQVLNPVVAYVQNGQLHQRIDIGDPTDLVLLQVEFLESDAERQQSFADFSEAVRLSQMVLTPKATCSSLCKH